MGPAPVNPRLLPFALGLICLAPSGFGIYLIGSYIIEWDWAMDFAADKVDRIPLFIHAIAGVGFLLLSAFQLLPAQRAANPMRHRRLGRPTAVLGLIGAGSGLWMVAIHPDISGPILMYGRIVSGSLWAIFIILAVRAILARDVSRHRAFMIRAFSLAATAGTLPFVYIPILLTYGEPGQPWDEIIQVAGWIINLSVAEWIIRRPPARRRLPTPKLQTV